MAMNALKKESGQRPTHLPDQIKGYLTILHPIEESSTLLVRSFK